MDKAIVILFESSVSLLLFYLVYYFWLRKETFFAANRFYLLLSVMVSLAIPWLNISFGSASSENIIFYKWLFLNRGH